MIRDEKEAERSNPLFKAKASSAYINVLASNLSSINVECLKKLTASEVELKLNALASNIPSINVECLKKTNSI